MTTAVLTHDGQLMLPREIRERLGVHQGDRVKLEVEDDGSVRLRPAHRATAVDEYLDLCHGTYDGLSDEEIDEVEAIALDRSRFRTRHVTAVFSSTTSTS